MWPDSAGNGLAFPMQVRPPVPGLGVPPQLEVSQECIKRPTHLHVHAHELVAKLRPRDIV